MILLFPLGASLSTPIVSRAALRRRLSLVSFSLSPRSTDCIFYAFATGYCLTFAALSILRHLSFNTDGYDMSIFDQVIWNSLRGRLFENSILLDAPLLIGQRFSPILLAFVPLYAIWSSPIMLMVVQTLGLAFGAFPLYWFARVRVGRLFALLICWTYFLFPALQYVNLEEFHEVSLTVPLYALATFFLLRQRYAPMLISLGLSLLVKEETAFVVAAFGIYLMLAARKWRLGLGVAAFGVTWSVLLLQYVLPFLNGSDLGKGYYYFGYGAFGMGRYDYLGHSLPEVIASLLTRPDLVLHHVLTLPKIAFVLYLIVPLAFLPLVGGEISALAIPTLATSVLSDYAPQYSIEFHYTASLIPFLFFGMVTGLQRFLSWNNSVSSHPTQRARLAALFTLILAASGGSYYLLAPGPLARHFAPASYTLNAHTAVGHTLLSMIPAESIVVAQGGLRPHLSERRIIFGFGSRDYCRAEYLVGDSTSIAYDSLRKEWDQWLGSGYFEMIRQEDGYLVARRRAPDQAVGIRYNDRMTLLRYTVETTATLRGGQSLCPAFEWRAERDVRDRYVVQVNVEDTRGHLFASDRSEPNGGYSPTTQLLAGQTLVDYHSVRLPPTIPPGVYQIAVSVYDASSDRLLSASGGTGGNVDLAPVIGVVRIEKDTSSVTANQLQIERPYFVDMGEIRFLGSTALPREVSVGDTLALGIYWRARGKPRGDYEVAVQLRNAGGRVILEEADRPAASTYPTTVWNLGEVLLDWHDLALPDQIPAGEYAISVILRDAASKAVLGEAPVTSISVRK